MGGGVEEIRHFHNVFLSESLTDDFHRISAKF